ncbi:MAG: hypothetical protein ACRD40_09840 [Candidatus Acidiferrales bacterium]
MMRLKIACVAVFAVLWTASASAQATVPIVSGGVGFLSATSQGTTTMQPVIAPVLTVPIGNRWLIESRADLRGFVFPQNGHGPYQAQFFDTLEYAQVDFLAANWLTISAGRFLTPFNMYSERLEPIWIQKFIDAPVIVPIGTTGGYSDGLMFRGSLVSRDNYQITYVTYFSTLSTINKLESQRSVGGRASVFLPHQRLEVGASYGRLLQSQRMNFEGLFFSWQPHALALDMKSEYSHSRRGQGYWLEAGYRLAKPSVIYTGLGRLEAIGRVQQFERLESGTGDSLPALDTQRIDAGALYHFPHEVRLSATYGRQFTKSGNRNIWEFGLTYRFLSPLWPGGSQ